jgi:serine/threonine protein kinase
MTLTVPIEELFREAQVMYMATHPNVVRVDCAFQTADLVCLGMRYFPDGSLLSKIDPSPLSPNETTRIGRGVLGGLAHVHTKGLIHFDLKPSNILMPGREPLIADFCQTRKMT